MSETIDSSVGELFAATPELINQLTSIGKQIAATTSKAEELAQESQQLFDKVKLLDADQQRALEQWLANLKNASPVYAASFFLDERRDFSNIEELQRCHQRGWFLHELGLMLREASQPVLVTRLKDQKLGFEQGEKEPSDYQLYEWWFGWTQTEEPLTLGYEETFSGNSGARVIKPLTLNLALQQTQYIHSKWRGFDDSTWLEEPWQERAKCDQVALLGSTASAAAKQVHQLTVRHDQAALGWKLTGWKQEPVMVVIGTQSIKDYTEELKSLISGKEYDQQAWELLEEQFLSQLGNS